MERHRKSHERGIRFGGAEVKQKLIEKVLRDGKASTNRFDYAVWGGFIWKRPKHCMGEWVKERRVDQ